jgi:hypothetical protein
VEADALERQVADCDGQGLVWPGAVLVAAEKLGADRGRLEDEDFLNAGDGRIGPDIGPGFGLIARGEDLDQQGRIGESAFFGVIAGTGDGEIGDADIGFRPNAGDHAGRGDDATRAGALLEVNADEAAKLGLYSAMGAVSRRRHILLSACWQRQTIMGRAELRQVHKKSPSAQRAAHKRKSEEM